MLTGYILRVAAVNKYGPGEPADTSVITTGSLFKAPQIDEQPVISDVSRDGCVLKWNKPTEDGGSPIYGYDVYIRENGGEWIKMNDELVFANRYVVGDLHSEIRYEFKVEAVNEAGLKSNSNLASEPLMIKQTLGCPTAILNIPRATITDENSVFVEWDEWEEETSSMYTVAYKSEGSSIWSEIDCSTNTCSVAELKEGVSYVFKVALRNEGGIGVFSDETEPIKVTQKVPPVIIKPIRSATIPKKRALQLECHATAEPAPEYIWYKDGKEIINEGYMSLLIIHSVDTGDTGSYTCEVENPYGSAKCTATVTVTDVRCHFVSSFSEYIEVIEGQDIELCCTLSDEDGVVVWYKDGKKLHEDDHLVISAEGTKRTLKISTVKDNDNGMYRCETSDGRSRTEGELVVKEEEPHISVGPQDLTVDQFGTEAQFRCELTRPAQRVLWYKNEQEIWPQANKYVITTAGNVSTLEIRNIDKNDIGNYSAALNEREVSAPAHLKLEVAPKIIIQENLEDELEFKAHEELAFHVEAIGYPNPTVTILHKDSRIQSRASVEEYDNVTSVRMKNLNRDDCGTVKITAENSVGIVHKEIRLTVLDVPSEPLDLNSSETTMDSTVLSWSSPEKTNGAPITGFIIERKAVDTSRWRPIGKTNANTKRFEATELFSSQVYGFRVIAVNAVGEGPPSQAIDVLTKEDEEVRISSSASSLLSILDTPDTPEASLDGTKVVLSWKAVPGASVYQLERQCDGADWREIVNTDGTDFVDSSLTQNGSFCYRVIAKSLDSESKPSDSTAPLLVILDASITDSREPDQLNGQAILEDLAVEGKEAVNGEVVKIDDHDREVTVDGAVVAPEETKLKKTDEEKKEDTVEQQKAAEEKKKKKTVKKKTKDVEKEASALTEKAQEDSSEVEQKVEKGGSIQDVTEVTPLIVDGVTPQQELLTDKEKEKEEIKGLDEKKADKKEEKKKEKEEVKAADDKKKDKEKVEVPDEKEGDKEVKVPDEKKAEKKEEKKKEKKEVKAEDDKKKGEEKKEVEAADDKIKDKEKVEVLDEKEEAKEAKVPEEKKAEKKEEKKKEKKEVKAEDDKKKGEEKQDKMEVPKLVLEPINSVLNLELGASGELKVKASVPTQFQWTKDGGSLPSEFIISGNETSSTVKILPAIQETAGEYKCTAISSDGRKVSTSIVVKVIGEASKWL
ncbi:unnamed protein product [Haemonchus placei]|uniref:Titin n=1 Tax=Haemonchus placei TaxID=6290 RepID=A0A0N4X136_HAEPC|nr:unnamed protein product [Haemonchus placei]